MYKLARPRGTAAVRRQSPQRSDETTASVHDNPPVDSTLIASRVLAGTMLGLLSALGYTAANVCLRTVADCDPYWVSCVKAVPTIALVAPWLMYLKWRGQRVFPSGRVLLILGAAGLFGHLGGNVAFQWSLGIIGIALAVPLTLGSIVVTGTWMGRVFLNETVTRRTVVSVIVLSIAIIVLSLGAGSTTEAAGPASIDHSAVTIWHATLGALAACFSGLAYSVLGIVIRYGVMGRSNIAPTLFIVSLVGLVSLSLITIQRLGWAGIAATDGRDMAIMIQAGIFNAIAFLALTKALQLTTVVFVNALNATQAAMGALIGVFWFRETPSVAMGVGVALTLAGLLLMRGTRAAISEPAEP